MTEKKLIDIKCDINRIKINKQWYMRMGPNCWYIEFDMGYEPLRFEDAMSAEKEYQGLKSIGT